MSNSQPSLAELMNKMGQVDEPGLRDPNIIKEQHKGFSEDGMSWYDARVAYDKVTGVETKVIKEKKEEMLKDIILEDKDRVRILGALHIIKEQVNIDLLKEKNPEEILKNITKVVKSFVK